MGLPVSPDGVWASSSPGDQALGQQELDRMTDELADHAAQARELEFVPELGYFKRNGNRGSAARHGGESDLQ